MTRDARPPERDWERPELGGEGVIDIDALSSQSETAGDVRSLGGWWARTISAVAIVSSLFHFYTAGYRPLPALEQRPIHLAFMLFLCFLLYSARRGRPAARPSGLDALLAGAGALSSLYLAWNFTDIAERGDYALPLDIVVGVVFCLTMVEAARRTMGLFLLVLSAVFVGYLFVGPYLPGMLGHGGFGFSRVVQQMYMSTEGVFGLAVGVAATYGRQPSSWRST